MINSSIKFVHFHRRIRQLVLISLDSKLCFKLIGTIESAIHDSLSFRISSLGPSSVDDKWSIMIPATDGSRETGRLQRATDASEFLRAWPLRRPGFTMLDPILGITSVWWLVVYASILLILSPLVLLFIVFLPNFPILLFRRMCYIPIESI